MLPLIHESGPREINYIHLVITIGTSCMLVLLGMSVMLE